MWRSIRQARSKLEISQRSQRFYSNSTTSSGSGTKVAIGAAAFVSVTAVGAIAYGKYDTKFRNLLETNIPYLKQVYKVFDEDNTKSSKVSSDKMKETAISSGLLKKKIDRSQLNEKQSSLTNVDENKDQSLLLKKDPPIFENSIKLPEVEIPSNSLTENLDFNNASFEKEVNDLIQKVQKSAEKSLESHNLAVKSIKNHLLCLYNALDLSDKDSSSASSSMLWKKATNAANEKKSSLKLSSEHCSDTKILLGKLVDISKKNSRNLSSDLSDKCDEIVHTIENQLNSANNEILSLNKESEAAIKYEKIINDSKEQFQKELKVISPSYNFGDKGISEDDFNLLLAHAHKRVEQLQKQLAKQEVEKLHSGEILKNFRIEEGKAKDFEKRDLEIAISKRVAHLKENFELELRQQLRRQAAAHSDHLQEVTKIQEQELDRKFKLKVEEELLRQRGAFISEVSGDITRLKGISAYLKTKHDVEKISKKTQALWLACQAMSHKISASKSGKLLPLESDIAAIKIATPDEENEFIITVLASIPSEALTRGIYSNEVLKERFFQNVKRISRKVAIIDENNHSLYRYILSNIQSFLIVDNESVPKAEIENKIAVDSSEWDNYDILSRISYCLKINDSEQALRYAGQLSGESKIVAADWIKEMHLSLETNLAVRALFAHVAAINVQAYH